MKRQEDKRQEGGKRWRWRQEGRWRQKQEEAETGRGGDRKRQK